MFTAFLDANVLVPVHLAIRCYVALKSISIGRYGRRKSWRKRKEQFAEFIQIFPTVEFLGDSPI